MCGCCPSAGPPTLSRDSVSQGLLCGDVIEEKVPVLVLGVEVRWGLALVVERLLTSVTWSDLWLVCCPFFSFCSSLK